MRSYRPEELFDANGRLHTQFAALAPHCDRRMGDNPHANGGTLLRDLVMPDFREYAADVPAPGVRGVGDTQVLGPFLRDMVKLNDEQRNVRIFGPDETTSNGLGAVFEATNRQWNAAIMPNDEQLAVAIVIEPVRTGRPLRFVVLEDAKADLRGCALLRGPYAASTRSDAASLNPHKGI